jgi:colanic acid biosynthesis glycosyl transferase WcaI
MHVLVHDYAGHPFQMELSRKLAHLGVKVSHIWFAADQGPKGNFDRRDTDPDCLAFVPLGQGIVYSKTNFLRRRAGDLAYGRAVAHWIKTHKPDCIISGNTPTEAQELILRQARGQGVPFVYWCQDFYSIAASRLLEKKLPVIGKIIGAYYRHLERRQMRQSSQILLITDSFCKQTDAWSIPRDKISIIPNWGALDEVTPMQRDTEWAKQKNLPNGARFIYTGTLALKHNPMLLEALAYSLKSDEAVVMVATGIGADQLTSRVANGSISRLISLPLQPFQFFGEVLASGDVLLAVIEREAGDFSVPSKVLNYLCAERPIVLAAPRTNLAAQIILETGAGAVVEPEDTEGFVREAKRFAMDKPAARSAGKAGREYAERTFNLDLIAEKFLQLITEAQKNA